MFSSSLAQVWFANEFVSVVCKTPISSNFLLENPQDPSTTRITCHLPPRMGSQGSDWFNLILKVGDEHCNRESRTTANKKDCKNSMSSQLFGNSRVIQTTFSNCFLVFNHFLDFIKKKD